MEDVLAGRLAADVAAQEVGHALQHAIAHRLEAAGADPPHRSEQPRTEPERIGVIGRAVTIAAEADPPDESVGAQVLDEAVEIDLLRVGARPLLQEDVAPLHEADAPAFGTARAARVKRVPRREQGTRHVLWLVSEVRDETAHDRGSIIRIRPRGATISRVPGARAQRATVETSQRVMSPMT